MKRRSESVASAFGIVAIAAIAGCSTPVDGAEAQQPVNEIAFHPCDGFTQESLKAAQIDVRAGSRLSDESANRSCSFRSRNPDYGVVISAIGEAPDSVKSDDRFDVLSETEIGGRRALVSDFRGGSACTVSVAIEPGILEFMIGYSELEDFTTVDAACDQATKVATTLAPYFPDHL
ncbi:DUF3558 domain-containing protein [Rhodococcus sp. NPDC127530]|uniref:DUF3558 domain-containing protein n=1 Tax=unclassified Rhodococcus (in: high G+C Gram-positive bacteria) TaxID=192944 RepID=UPI00363BDE32